jgi:hypothetical protein
VFKTLKIQFEAQNTPNAEQNGFCEKSGGEILYKKSNKCFLQCKHFDLKNKSGFVAIE